MPSVNHEILRWARESAGLTESAAAEKLKLGAAHGVPGVDRLRGLEEGETSPTRPLLLKMAKTYHRPILTFYLSRPPQTGDHGQDFRTLPQDYSVANDALMQALIREVLARQSLMRSAMIDEEEAQPLSFVGSMDVSAGVQSVLASITRTLEITRDDFRAADDADEAFKLLRARAETAGIFVLLVGNLGSHHTNIDRNVFRGFALADPVLPMVIINDQDHHAAWSFTLLHELVHIWLGQTGISGGTPDRGIERFCNDVAGEFLMPSAEIAALPINHEMSLTRIATMIGEFAQARNVSNSMIAYGLYRRQLINRTAWQALDRHFRERWLETRERDRLSATETGGGPNYYVVRRHRLGPGFIRMTARLLEAGALTTSKAGRVLGVKPQNVQTLIEQLR